MATDSIFSYIQRLSDGSWTANHGQFTLKSALQPLFRQRLDGSLDAVGAEGFLRPFIDNLAMAPDQFFASADLRLVENVDSLSRMIHILNYGTFSQQDGQSLFISFHPAMLQSADHILRELERLHICAEEVGLNPERVICQMSSKNQPEAERLSFFADAVRNARFRLAISHITHDAFALPSAFSVKPNYIKLTGDWLALGMNSQSATGLLKRVIERCAVLEIEPVITNIETKVHLSYCRQLHPVHLQGHILSKPVLATKTNLSGLPISLQAAPITKQRKLRPSTHKLFAAAISPVLINAKSKAVQFGKRQTSDQKTQQHG